jgi:universal stress protein E
MKNITVAIGYPDRVDQWALLKAAAIAERCAAQLTLLHTFSLPYPLSGSSYRSTAELVQEAGEARRQQLMSLVERLGIRHARIRYAIEWDVPVAAAIVRHVLRTSPDLLVADSHRHGRFGRWLLTNTDWNLIRSVPCPLWFVKTPQLPKRLQALAAVDPAHVDAAHSGLDGAILKLALGLQRQVGATIRLAHVLDPRDEAAGHDAIGRLMRRHRLGALPCVFGHGDPATAIPALALAEEADVVVMGAVSRRARGNAFIGGTAERVIDQLRCDILVVKPPGFETDVSAKPALKMK